MLAFEKNKNSALSLHTNWKAFCNQSVDLIMTLQQMYDRLIAVPLCREPMLSSVLSLVLGGAPTKCPHIHL